MDINQIISNLLGLVAGVGIFMVACETLSKNLQAISSKKLKSLFSKVSNNKIIGVCIGALTTMLIQSSGATTVMLIGFVNTNIISLNQAATIILGSEIGTTLTGQIVALGMFGEQSISLTAVFATFVGIGAFLDLAAKKDKTKSIAGIMVGFGMIFVGLSLMSSSMDSFAKLDALKSFIATIKSPVLLIFIGAILTALIQSSSAMTTIAIAMIASSLINIEQGIYITLGANVGSCVTGALAALTSGTNAKRTSVFQLIFNIGGVILVAVCDGLIKLSSNNALSFASLIAGAFPNVPSTQLAMFHTIFNVATVLLALPLSDGLVSLCLKLVKESESDKDGNRLYYFDENMMSTPTIAVSIVKNEIINMADIAIGNFNTAIDTITKLDFSKKKEFDKNEDELDYLNTNLVVIVSRLSQLITSAKDSAFLSSSYRVISDLERIGDYSVNIVEYAEYLQGSEQSFSKTAIDEIEQARAMVNELYKASISVYTHYNEELMQKAFEIEEKIDDITEMMSDNHIKRMNKGECNADLGAQYLQLSSDVERIADHLININDKDYIFTN